MIYDENYWQKRAEQLMGEKKSHLKETYDYRQQLKELQTENEVLQKIIKGLTHDTFPERQISPEKTQPPEPTKEKTYSLLTLLEDHDQFLDE